MTKQLSDLFKSFSSMNIEEQLEQIKKIRSARHIERPVAAAKRVKREVKKSNQAMDKARQLMLSLTPEQKIALVEKMKGGK